MNKVFQNASLQIRNWKSTPRIWIVFIFIIIFLESYKSYGNFCVENHMAMSPWIYSLIFSDEGSVFVFFSNIILLFANAPFMEEYQLFYFMRCGKKKWYTSQILYIFLASIIYFSTIFLVSIIYLSPYMSFQTEWGKIFMTISRNITQFSIVVERFSAITATVYSLAIHVLIGVFLGLLLFDLNLLFKRGVGIMCALFFVILSYVLGYVEIGQSLMSLIWRYVSPISWARMSFYHEGIGGLPLWYPFVVLGICIGVLFIFGMVLVNKRPFEVQEEM